MLQGMHTATCFNTERNHCEAPFCFTPQSRPRAQLRFRTSLGVVTGVRVEGFQVTSVGTFETHTHSSRTQVHTHPVYHILMCIHAHWFLLDDHAVYCSFQKQTSYAFRHARVYFGHASVCDKCVDIPVHIVLPCTYVYVCHERHVHNHTQGPSQAPPIPPSSSLARVVFIGTCSVISLYRARTYALWMFER